MHWLQALVAVLVSGFVLAVGWWIAPQDAPRSARVTAFVLVAVACLVAVLVILVQGLRGFAA